CGSTVTIRAPVEMWSWEASVAPDDPSAYACVASEKQVTPTTHANATGLALSWIQREKPVRRSVESGSELPAMNPATHANACRARTSELRNRIASTSVADGGSVMPGIDMGVGSGSATEEISQTTASKAAATPTAPATQLRSTGHGSSFQRASAPRVWRAPRTSTYWFASTG